MRWRAIGMAALCVLACAAALACGGGGSSKTTTIKKPSFAQGFLPVLLEGALLSDPCQSSLVRTAGDVAFRDEGDLLAVAQGSDVFAVSRADGSCRVFAHVSGATLLSIATGTGDDLRTFVGDTAGRIWTISLDGNTVNLYVDTGSGQPITGLAFAPNGYGDVGGSLLAAAGTAGVLRITISDVPAVGSFAPNPSSGSIVDLAFFKKTLFAIVFDGTDGEIDKIEVSDTTGTASTFQTGFADPVGIAIDDDAEEIYVADAGDDILKTVPVAGGAPTKRASYDFDPDAVNGIAFDGIATLAWITVGPLAIRGANLPRIDPADSSFGRIFDGPNSGYGDLELDRFGEFVLVANHEDDPDDDTDKVNNYLFSVPRNANSVKTLKSGIGTPPEQLFAVAIDPVSESIYFSGFSVDAAVEIGNIYKRDADENVTLLVGLTPNVRILGLELAPPTFGGFGGQLIATTEDARVFAVDPQSPSTPVQIPLSAPIPPGPPVSHLVDLVFASTGELYAVDNNGSANVATAARILRITPTGTVTVIAPSSSSLGAADGIEIDEGGDRLLVTTQNAGGFQLIEVSLGAIPGTVKSLANIQIDDGLFPTGVVYDRLGTVAFRRSDANTQLGVVSVAP